MAWGMIDGKFRYYKSNECENSPNYYTACDNDDCQECCEHDDADDYCCLICGKDMQETFMSRAEYYADMKEDR